MSHLRGLFRPRAPAAPSRGHPVRVSALDDWQERRLPRPPEARPGFLSAFAELMNVTAQAWRSAGASGPGRPPSPVVYMYRAKVFELHQDKVELVRDLTLGARRYARALRGRFRLHNRETGGTSGEYTVIYAADREWRPAAPWERTRPRPWSRSQSRSSPVGDADGMPRVSRSWARGTRMPRSCSSAKDPADKRRRPGGRSSAGQGCGSAARSETSGWTNRPPTSPVRSRIARHGASQVRRMSFTAESICAGSWDQE